MDKKRRASLKSICDQLEPLRDKLEAIRDREQECLSNMEGTGLEYTDNYQLSEQALGFLDEAMEGLDDVLSNIQDAMEQ